MNVTENGALNPSNAAFQKGGIAFLGLSHALFGLYVYEWFLSLDFEWEFLTRKRQFRWPMIFYFANRYCALASVIGTVIAMDIKPITNDCAALYIFIQLTAAIAVGLASINLSIRTIAIWSSNKYVVGGLILAIIGQWAFIFIPVSRLKVQWSIHCLSPNTTKILSAFFIYAMCFDLIVLLLTSYKLFVLNPAKMSRRSRLAQMIFVDGLRFFIVAFLANLMATIFIAFDPLVNIAAAVFCTVAACRAVRRLRSSVQNVNVDSASPVAPAVPKAISHPSCAVHIQKEISYHHDGRQSGDVEKALSIIECNSAIEEAKNEDQKASFP